jgi:hypothetical protein
MKLKGVSLNVIGSPYHFFRGNGEEVYSSSRSSIQYIWYFISRFVILLKVLPLKAYPCGTFGFYEIQVKIIAGIHHQMNHKNILAVI